MKGLKNFKLELRLRDAIKSSVFLWWEKGERS